MGEKLKPANSQTNKAAEVDSSRTHLFERKGGWVPFVNQVLVFTPKMRLVQFFAKNWRTLQTAILSQVQRNGGSRRRLLVEGLKRGWLQIFVKVCCLELLFFCPSPLPFSGSTVLSLSRGPAKNRTTTGSLSATQECRDTNCTTRTTVLFGIVLVLLSQAFAAWHGEMLIPLRHYW